MRPEEWIPLEHSDIDEQARTVTIRRTYTEDKGLEEFAGVEAVLHRIPETLGWFPRAPVDPDYLD